MKSLLPISIGDFGYLDSHWQVSLECLFVYLTAFSRGRLILDARIKIANILLSKDPQFLAAPTLLIRSSNAFHVKNTEDPCSPWILEGPGKHDFTTYFNALPIMSWRKYTSAKKFGIHLSLRGSCKVALTRADAFSFYSESVSGSEFEIAASEDWQSVDIELPSSKSDVLEAFAIECDAPVEIGESYYYAVVDEDDVRDVELALCTTTFKKEEFITRNVNIIKGSILNSTDDIAQHFSMHVVDNGRTLDPEQIAGPHVYLHPNDNVGGAGGFARGMIEAMEQAPKATHVLLMDDDVLISPESIVRTFNLLKLVNEEYSEAFVSGAMMNMDEPNVRWEEMGFIGFDGNFHPVKPVAHMDAFHEMVASETFDIPSYMPKCEDQNQHYAAWWYCAIPMSQVDRNGLPLPIFVRGDDVEYSRRCAPNFITMNGICIWHLSFHMRYNAAQERYQMTRNCLIDQYASNFAPLSDFKKTIKKNFFMELSKFNYDDAELILDAVEDFLKGPEWLVSDAARSAFLDANKRAAKTYPFEEIEPELKKLGIDLSALTDWKIWRDLPYSSMRARIDRLSTNGSKFELGVKKNPNAVAIDNVGWAYPAGKLYGSETVVSIDVPNRRAAIRKIDRARFTALAQRYKKDVAELKARDSELKELYSKAFSQMTSSSFWKSYLGIE